VVLRRTGERKAAAVKSAVNSEAEKKVEMIPARRSSSSRSRSTTTTTTMGGEPKPSSTMLLARVAAERPLQVKILSCRPGAAQPSIDARAETR
jgi:Mrp family chromosome partitioning ATPase